jgi:superfamily II DNA or RNA helicase
MRYVRLSNGRSPRSVLDKKLWSNQRDALSIAAQYLDSPSPNQAIIRMPTGTGNTAIIATLAQLTDDYLHVLIVVPWEHLAAQLSREVSNHFWEKCGLARVLRIRPVAQFTPASLAAKLDAHNGSQVLICTNQSLERLYSKNVPLFTRLKAWVSAGRSDHSESGTHS